MLIWMLTFNSCEKFIWFAFHKHVSSLKLYVTFVGRNHPKYPKEDYLDVGRQTPPTTPELKRMTTPLSASKEQDELRKDLKFNQQR